MGGEVGSLVGTETKRVLCQWYTNVTTPLALRVYDIRYRPKGRHSASAWAPRSVVVMMTLGVSSRVATRHGGDGGRSARGPCTQ